MRFRDLIRASVRRRCCLCPVVFLFGMPGTLLDDRFTEPRGETIAALRACPGDVVVLGAGGKMGPSLTAMLARAAKAVADQRRIVAVSRWSDREAKRALEEVGVVTVSCDLLDRSAVAELPDAPNVIFMAGQKFGTQGRPSVTWAMNTLVPTHAAERYPQARIVVFSTGNVYPLVPVTGGGALETDAPGPIGEYAMSCLGRERLFEHFSARNGTGVVLYRLNYAIDVRYGVLLDIAQKVFDGAQVPLAMGYVNVIWQGDANRIAIEALPLAASPPFVVNVTGRETLSVRDLATRFGNRFGKEPRFEGREGPDALLSNTSLMDVTFAAPRRSIDEMIEQIATAVEQKIPTLGKPTHFETRDGGF
jgi:nucleoside-diphosphate-sugar epimerase